MVAHDGRYLVRLAVCRRSAAGGHRFRRGPLSIRPPLPAAITTFPRHMHKPTCSDGACAPGAQRHCIRGTGKAAPRNTLPDSAANACPLPNPILTARRSQAASPNWSRHTSAGAAMAPKGRIHRTASHRGHGRHVRTRGHGRFPLAAATPLAVKASVSNHTTPKRSAPPALRRVRFR
jgi:hypothetical protein